MEFGQQKLCHHGETGCSADATGYQQALSDGVSATRACVSSLTCLSVMSLRSWLMFVYA